MKPSVLKALAASFVLICLLPFLAYSQSPEKLNYQAVIRDNAGAPVTDTQVELELMIRQGSATGTAVYSETHTVTTNELGMIQVYIGQGTTTDVFADIDWAQGPWFLSVNVDQDPLGTMELVSVPYALWAEKAGNVFSGAYADLTGKPDLTSFLSTEEDPVFTAAAAAGITQAFINHWNEAYGWGNHAEQGYITDPDDADPDPENEIQDLSLSGNTLTITKKTSPASIDLSPYLDNSHLWTQTNDSLYYLNGNVGIGTKDPKSTLTVEGTTPTDSAIFEVKNSMGRTLFAVYEEGVRINIYEDLAKGRKGGFAIGGFNPAKGPGKQFDYFSVTPDSMRITFYEDFDTKGAKGGFAIGGFNRAKAGPPISKYLEVTADQTSGQQGLYNTTFGYQSGGTFFSDQSGYGGDYNVSLGYQAGYRLTDGGISNINIGNKAGYNNTTGDNNTFIGNSSGYANTTGSINLAIGHQAGKNNQEATNQFFIGNNAGMKLKAGYGNTFVGHSAGENSDTVRQSTILGYYAGYSNTDGDYNVAVGYAAANQGQGSYNVIIGEFAAYNQTSGDENVILGRGAGYNTNGSGNVFLGHNAGTFGSLSNVNEALIISNNVMGAKAPLIYGSFQSTDPYVIINGTSRASSDYEFYVNGDAGGSTAWNSYSDFRLKKDIATIPNALAKVQQLRGINYRWKDSQHMSDGLQMGFIAQEAVKVIPEVVNTEGEYYSMQYAPITALLVEAVKELKAENDALKAEVESLRRLQTQLNEMQEQIRLLKEKQ